MTAKILSWSTFGLLVASALPFVTDPSVAPAASSNLTGRIGAAAVDTGGLLVPCGACRIKQDEEFRKTYAVDRNTLCPPEEPYRIMVRLATRVYCEKGTYWVCTDTSTMQCDPYTARPECPVDSCERTK